MASLRCCWQPSLTELTALTAPALYYLPAPVPASIMAALSSLGSVHSLGICHVAFSTLPHLESFELAVAGGGSLDGDLSCTVPVRYLCCTL
jgi:hypothetical protein